LLAGDENSLVEAGLINRLTDSAKRFKPLPTSVTLVEEVPDSLLEQFVGGSIQATCELLLQLLCQIGW
jgi:hypothetical protein